MNLTMVTSAATVSQHWTDGSHNAGPPFFVFPFLWLVLVGGVLAALFVTRPRRDRDSGKRAGERTLAEAYAAGQIDDQTYRTRRAVLREKD